MLIHKTFKLSTIAWSLAVIIVVVIGLIVGLILRSGHHDAPVMAKNPGVKPSSVSLGQLTQSLDKSLLAKYVGLSNSSSLDQTATLGYQASGDNFRVALPLNSALTLSDKTSASENSTYSYLSSVLPGLTKYLMPLGFSAPQNATPSDALLSSVYFYQSEKSVCEVTTYTLLDITCAPLNTINNLASEAKPFVLLYQSAKSSSLTPTVLSTQISPSQTTGYQIAYVDFSDATQETKVDYYRQSQAAWQIVNLGWYNDPHEDGDIMPNCADFESSPSVALAYAGVMCYNSDTQAQSVIR